MAEERDRLRREVDVAEKRGEELREEVHRKQQAASEAEGAAERLRADAAVQRKAATAEAEAGRRERAVLKVVGVGQSSALGRLVAARRVGAPTWVALSRLARLITRAA